MTENPLETVANAFESLSRALQTHLSRLFSLSPPNSNSLCRPSPKEATLSPHLAALSPGPSAANRGHASQKTKQQGQDAAPFTKEELGRATWTLLHSIAAQYPDQPTRQQKRDVKELMGIVSRIYPCKECAEHFKEVLKAYPVQAGSQDEFSQWLCHVHNVVNRSLGKLIFPCNRVNARWGKLDCKDHTCDLQGTSDFKNQLE